ncbi:MAG: NADH-quinone oxidoreductase subunit C [Bradyrhizobium sp.]|nr:NADH-quinone oxidoreductase subunit C [Bradyrhizobium sp.]
MALLDGIPCSSAVTAHRPWPRVVVDADGWQKAIDRLVANEIVLLGLWGETDVVHMALASPEGDAIAVISLECRGGTFPSVGARHAPARRLERAISDLFGLEAAGTPDDRPWLDHQRWDCAHPLGKGGRPKQAIPYRFLPSEGEGLHQVAVGPVHAGIIEPGHFRFAANGEFVVRLEGRLGYVHKGIEALMSGATLDGAARLACRTSGDSAVAYSYAFVSAVESALQIEVPARAVYLRALAAELERLGNHFGDIGAICNDASFALMHAQTGILRERCLRVAETCFGHRLMMDLILPGGLARDLAVDGHAAVTGLLAEIDRAFPRLIELYDKTASLQDRTVGTGVVKPAYARLFGAGGYVGRASGRPLDARRSPGYAPYRDLSFEVPTLQEGDVNARVWIRIREVEQSVQLIRQILAQLPAGAIRAALPSSGEPAEGLALVEAFRGDVLVWVRLDEDRRIARCHLRDASWFQWPLVEAAIEGNIIADFPLCNKSFNCSYSGHDL